MYEKRKYSHVMLVRRVRTRNTKDQKTGRSVSSQLTSSLRMIQSDFYFCQLCEEWSLRRWKPSSKKKVVALTALTVTRLEDCWSRGVLRGFSSTPRHR